MLATTPARGLSLSRRWQSHAPRAVLILFTLCAFAASQPTTSRIPAAFPFGAFLGLLARVGASRGKSLNGAGEFGGEPFLMWRMRAGHNRYGSRSRAFRLLIPIDVLAQPSVGHESIASVLSQLGEVTLRWDKGTCRDRALELRSMPGGACRPGSVTKRRPRRLPDAQLSAQASHLPTPKATGWEERPATGNRTHSFPGPPVLLAVCL